MRSKAIQTSESLELALVLALSGGLMDAYSYLARGKVFANAQTGNLLLLGVNLSTGNWDVIGRYLSPIIAFALGCIASELIRHRHKHENPKEPGIHWRQHVVLGEIVLLAIVTCLGSDYNLIANSLTSLACGMQVQAFRKLHGHAFATTMCIGNLRSGT
ncbi:YoaK family protein, partial [uncultured Olegusella sp.]|uniref:YoaK family protein n=1 Tax=uncultured Olegusella sp. TaxID=1979846 RepID=UPI00262E92CA